MKLMFNPRLDRAVSVEWARMRRLMPRRGRTPILMYHSLSNEFGDRHPYFETNTSPEAFAAHMRYLSENGYETVGLGEAAGETLGEYGKKVVITFDDGYRDFYTEGVPVLANYGFRATMFVVSEFAAHGKAANGKPCMSWNEIREVQRCGIEIGSHTASHPELYKLPHSELCKELTASKQSIEQQIGAAVDSFAYPYAFPEHRQTFLKVLRALLGRFGYKRGVCTSVGTAGPSSDPFFMPRIPMNSHDDLRFLEAKLQGGYDWLHLAQSAYKLIQAQS
jgi:peptidoglycan/xylan/chitin deacetylase (PgdA/CDA1 family)